MEQGINLLLLSGLFSKEVQSIGSASNSPGGTNLATLENRPIFMI
jgi:hypothetical protein